MKIKTQNYDKTIEQIQKKVNDAIASNEEKIAKYHSAYETLQKEIDDMKIVADESLNGEDSDAYAIAQETLRKLTDKMNFYKIKMDSTNALNPDEFAVLENLIKTEYTKIYSAYEKSIFELAEEIMELAINYNSISTIFNELNSTLINKADLDYMRNIDFFSSNKIADNLAKSIFKDTGFREYISKTELFPKLNFLNPYVFYN